MDGIRINVNGVLIVSAGCIISLWDGCVACLIYRLQDTREEGGKPLSAWDNLGGMVRK